MALHPLRRRLDHRTRRERLCARPRGRHRHRHIAHGGEPVRAGLLRSLDRTLPQHSAHRPDLPLVLRAPRTRRALQGMDDFCAARRLAVPFGLPLPRPLHVLARGRTGSSRHRQHPARSLQRRQGPGSARHAELCARGSPDGASHRAAAPYERSDEPHQEHGRRPHDRPARTHDARQRNGREHL